MVQKETIGNIEKFILKNDDFQAEFISFGARMTRLSFKGTDVLLGYDNAEDYLTDTLFIGSTVGRFAGRIGNTSLSLNAKSIQLDRNENGTTCHHGGYNAFDKKFWISSVVNENTISFSRTAIDGEGGFPGNLEVSVQYTLLQNGIEVKHTAKCDQDTIVNLTNHAYFNLNGFDDPDSRELFLHLPADYYLPLNEKLIPTGEIANVSGTDFDFTSEKRIGMDLDHYFVYRHEEGVRYGGSLFSDKSGIRMDIETNQPGIQIYTCGAFEAKKGKGGIPLHLHQGIALETQGFPDSPNHSNFPSSILKACEVYSSKTRFLFTATKP